MKLALVEKRLLDEATSEKRREVVAFVMKAERAPRLVLDAVVVKKLVVVALSPIKLPTAVLPRVVEPVEKRLRKVPKPEKKETDEVPFSVLNLVEEAVVEKKEVVVAPLLVSIEKTDEEAEFRTSKVKPLTGDWMVVVPP